MNMIGHSWKSFGIRISFRVGALGALGVVGLLLVGIIYLTGQRFERSLQIKADLATSSNDRFATALAHLADSRQAEAAFALHANEAEYAIHKIALDDAQTSVSELVDAGISDTSRAGAILLGKSIDDYEATSELAIGRQRLVAAMEDGTTLSNLIKSTAILQHYDADLDGSTAAFILALQLDVAHFMLKPDRAVVAAFDGRAVAFGAARQPFAPIGAERQALANSIVQFESDFDAYAIAKFAALDAAFASERAFEEARVAGEAARGLAVYQAKIAQAGLASARNDTGTLMRLTIAAVVAAVSVLAWLIGRGIARPLNHVAQQTHRLTSGDRDFAICHTSRTDEIGDVARALSMFRDTMDQNAAAAKLIYDLAHYDPLTRLGNRMLVQGRLAEAVATAERDATHFAVICIDLDGFKAVNDLYGHATGDLLLRDVASRLIHNLRDHDLAGRIGGDEFVVIQGASSQPIASQGLAERLLKMIAEPYDLPSGYIRGIVTTSIGVAVFPLHGADPETLLRNADTALYRAKIGGKNNAVFFEPEMDQALRQRRVLERDIGQALAKGEFALAWQPIAEAAPGHRVTGFEVLLRWNRPGFPSLSPETFIPVTESTGAIILIGEWVLREACQEAARWSLPLGVAVNISLVQVQNGDQFCCTVEQALRDSNLAASRLTLEVTEGVFIKDVGRVLATLLKIKALGVHIALDDFGTGYSSLATLRSFPFDKIKIDRSFIAGIAAGGQDAAIVCGVLGLARGLGLPAIAEGVETAAQLAILYDAGCEEVQGWVIGKPAAIGSFDTGTVVAAPWAASNPYGNDPFPHAELTAF